MPKNILSVDWLNEKYNLTFDAAGTTLRNAEVTNITEDPAAQCTRDMSSDEVKRLFGVLTKSSNTWQSASSETVEATALDITEAGSTPVVVAVQGGITYHDARISEILPDNDASGPQYYVGDVRMPTRVTIAPVCDTESIER